MAEKSTFIKLDRNILEWRWFHDANTLKVWLYILVKCNITDHDFENITVKRGQFITSLETMSKDLKMSVKSIRTALNHLKRTSEVASKSTNKYTLVTALNYNLYQDKGQTKGQTRGNPRANQGQQYKNVKNEKEVVVPPQLFEISSYCSENGLNVNAEKFYDYYSGNGWKTSQGKPITDWKALLQKWSETEREKQAVVKKRNNNTLSGLPLLGSDDDDD